MQLWQESWYLTAPVMVREVAAVVLQRQYLPLQPSSIHAVPSQAESQRLGSLPTCSVEYLSGLYGEATAA